MADDQRPVFAFAPEFIFKLGHGRGIEEAINRVRATQVRFKNIFFPDVEAAAGKSALSLREQPGQERILNPDEPRLRIFFPQGREEAGFAAPQFVNSGVFRQDDFFDDLVDDEFLSGNERGIAAKEDVIELGRQKDEEEEQDKNENEL